MFNGFFEGFIGGIGGSVELVEAFGKRVVSRPFLEVSHSKKILIIF